MAIAPPVPRPAPQPPFLINRDFALLWFGQAISNVGDFVLTTTLLLWIATRLARDQAWAPLAVGGISLAVSLPTLLVGPLAGVFVDRWDKRRTMLRMDAVRALLILGLAALPLLAERGLPGEWQLAAIYAVVVLATIAAQFFNPSRLALIGDIVEPPLRARASSLTLMTLSLGLILGPPLAAPLFFAIGAEGALLVDALSFGVSFLVLAAVRAPPPTPRSASAPPASIRQEFVAGLRFAFGNRVIRTILLATVVTLFGSSAVNALDIFFLTANLHAPPDQLGLLGGATGAGILIGAPLAGWVAGRIGVPRTFWLATLAAGGLIVVFARLTGLVPVLAVLALLGLPGAGVNIAIGPILLHVTPRELVGRVSAIFTPVNNMAALLSVALAGYLASTVLRDFRATVLGLTLGPIDTIYTVAGLLIVVAGLYAARNLRALTMETPAAPLPAPPPHPADPPEPSAASLG
jgi:MFS family permease